MESTTRTNKTTTSTSNKTFNALTTKTTRILGYSYSNFAIKQQHKQHNTYDYLCNGATQQSVLAFLILWRISYISSITNFVHFIDPRNSVLG